MWNSRDTVDHISRYGVGKRLHEMRKKTEELLILFCDLHRSEIDWVGNKSIIASTVMTDDVMTISTSVMCVNFTILDYYCFAPLGKSNTTLD